VKKTSGIIFLLLFCIGSALGQTFPDKPFARLGKGTINQIAYSPDGKLLAVAGSVGIWLYDASNLQEVGLLQGHTGVVSSIAFSSNGKIIASAGGGDDNTVRLWNVEEKKEIAVLEENSDRRNSLALSPDGKILVVYTYGPQSIRLLDITRGKEIAVLEGHGPVAFSPDGKTLAFNGKNGGILWDVEEKKEIAVLEENSYWNSVAFSPDGKTIAIGHWYLYGILGLCERCEVQLWDVAEKKRIAVFEGDVNVGGPGKSIAFSPDGKMLASSGGTNQKQLVWLFDIAAEKEMFVLEENTRSADSIIFSPDGKTLAWVSEGATVYFWGIAEQKEIAVLKGHNLGRVYSLAFSPDGRTIASVEAQWRGIALKPETSICSWAVRLWDVAERKEKDFLQGYDLKGMCAAAFSPDGKTIALASITTRRRDSSMRRRY